MYEEYKGTRKPMPEELAQQLPVAKQMLAAALKRLQKVMGFLVKYLLTQM